VDHRSKRVTKWLDHAKGIRASEETQTLDRWGSVRSLTLHTGAGANQVSVSYRQGHESGRAKSDSEANPSMSPTDIVTERAPFPTMFITIACSIIIGRALIPKEEMS